MRRANLGYLLIALGVLAIGYALLVMDVTLEENIVNLDLLNTRQNIVMVGGLVVLVGVLLVLLPGSGGQQPRPSEQSWTKPSWVSGRNGLALVTIVAIPLGLRFLYAFLFLPKVQTGIGDGVAGVALVCGGIFAWVAYMARRTKNPKQNGPSESEATLAPAAEAAQPRDLNTTGRQ